MVKFIILNKNFKDNNNSILVLKYLKLDISY